MLVALHVVPAVAEDAPPAEWSGEVGPEEPGAPAPSSATPGPVVRADGRWSLGAIFAVGESDVEYGVRAGAGLFAWEGFRADLVATVLAERSGAFSTAGMTVPGIETLGPWGESSHQGLALELTLTYRGWRAEPWLGIGVAREMAHARVSGRGLTCDVLLLACGQQDRSASDLGTATGATIALGVNLPVLEHLLVALELRQTVPREIRLADVPLRVQVGGAQVGFSVLFRGGEAMSGAPRTNAR